MSAGRKAPVLPLPPPPRNVEQLPGGPAVAFDDIEALEHAGDRSGVPLLVKALCLIARELRLLRAGVRP